MPVLVERLGEPTQKAAAAQLGYKFSLNELVSLTVPV